MYGWKIIILFSHFLLPKGKSYYDQPKKFNSYQDRLAREALFIALVSGLDQLLKKNDGELKIFWIHDFISNDDQAAL